MHSIELAVLTARLIDRLMQPDGALDWKAFELETYWSASRIRLDRWTRALQQLPTAAQWQQEQQNKLASQFQAFASSAPVENAESQAAPRSLVRPSRARILKPHAPAAPALGPHFAAAQPPKSPAASSSFATTESSNQSDAVESDPKRTALRLLEEILVAEIQCRVFTCLLEQTGGRETTKAAASVVRSVWLGHQEIRCRILAWLAEGIGVSMPLADEVNRIRRRCERWSDLLLAKIGGDLAQSFSVDAARFAQFAQMEDESIDVVVEVEPMLRGSLEQMFGLDGEERAAFPDLNQQIYQSIARVVDGRKAEPTLQNLQNQVSRLMIRVQGWIDRCNQD